MFCVALPITWRHCWQRISWVSIRSSASFRGNLMTQERTQVAICQLAEARNLKTCRMWTRRILRWSLRTSPSLTSRRPSWCLVRFSKTWPSTSSFPKSTRNWCERWVWGSELSLKSWERRTQATWRTCLRPTRCSSTSKTLHSTTEELQIDNL